MINKKELHNFKHRFFLFKGKPNSTYTIDDKIIRFNKLQNLCIYDWVTKKIILYTYGDESKTVSLKYENNILKKLKIFDKYKVDDIEYILGEDKVNSQKKVVGNIYVVGGIWMGYTYVSHINTPRMCLNTNIFGSKKYLNSREFNLEVLLQE
jgi:hypothetical protein